MSRRTLATLLAMALLTLLTLGLLVLPVPYVTMSPGPTVDVLGKKDGKPVIEVQGHPTYPTKGQLDLVTVLVTNPDARLNLLRTISAWVDPDVAVLPYAAVYAPGTTREQNDAQDAAMMVNSQDTAVAAALTELGYDLDTYAEVTGVDASGPSKGKLKPRDRVLRLDGTRVTDVEGLLTIMDRQKPGDVVSGVVRRDGRRVPFSVTTVASPSDPSRAVLGVLVGTGFDFPFDVRVTIPESIGGPSAGLVFALSIYDKLTPGALLRDDTVAGTGTISADGQVGVIGGIQQKIVAARDSGAEIFLVPPGNCAEALGAPVDESDIRLVRADTLASAVDSLETYAEDPSADLPRCPS